MMIRTLLTGFAFCGLLLSVHTAWAGAPNANPALRESLFLPHVCKGGPDAGMSCTVMWPGGDPNEVVTDDCPKGKCIIDYVSKRRHGELTILVDDDVTNGADPETSLGKVLTLFLCVKKNRESHCFTESYRPVDPDGFNIFNIGGMTTFGEGVVSWADTPEELLLLNWKFLAPEASFLSPEGDLTQELRDLFETTGSPVLIDIKPNSVQGFDHIDDLTGSILSFKFTMRFVNGLQP